MTEYEPSGAAGVVVVEWGAQSVWRPDIDGVAEASARAVLAQQRDETPGEFALRVSRAIASITRGRTSLEAGVFVTSDADSDDLVFNARCTIARAMLSAMEHARAPRIVFQADTAVSEASREDLMTLVETLTGQLATQPVEVQLRFVEARTLRPVRRAAGDRKTPARNEPAAVAAGLA